MKLYINSGEAYPVFWCYNAADENPKEWAHPPIEVPDEQANTWLVVLSAYREVQREMEAADDAFWSTQP